MAQKKNNTKDSTVKKCLHDSASTFDCESGERIDPETNLKIPSDFRVETAKEWVDHGSRL